MQIHQFFCTGQRLYTLLPQNIPQNLLIRFLPVLFHDPAVLISQLFRVHFDLILVLIFVLPFPQI